MGNETKSGTREWSTASVNCISGCRHRCRYCYARADAVRRKTCPGWESWGTTYCRVRPSEVAKCRRKIAGRIMFPTTHDIWPEVLEPCLQVLRNLLQAGNEILIVTKPHLECVEAIMDRLAEFREQVLFRFSIGSLDPSTLRWWEPGAPDPTERYACLIKAHVAGWQTSVSCEPLLSATQADLLFKSLAPHVTDTIWIGKANKLRQRMAPGDLASPIGRAEVARIEAGQTDEMVRWVYEALKGESKVRWKDSYRKALVLE